MSKSEHNLQQVKKAKYAIMEYCVSRKVVMKSWSQQNGKCWEGTAEISHICYSNYLWGQGLATYELVPAHQAK